MSVEKLPLVDVTPVSGASEDAPARTWAPDQVAPDRRLRMHFSLALTSGDVIDENFGRQAVEFSIGDGNLLPSFEQVLFGLRAGDKARFELPPEQAFGQPNEENVQRFPRHRFPPDLVLEPGLMVAFNDASGYEQAGVVVAQDKTQVTVDFNHPLAGRTIVFTVEILSVEPA